MALSSAWGVLAEVGGYWQSVRRPLCLKLRHEALVDSLPNRKPTTGGRKSRPSTPSSTT